MIRKNEPWIQSERQGVVIANDANELHGNNNLNKETALSEKGERINARGDKPNTHDILTGSQPDGRAFSGDEDRTCRNWTSSRAGAAMLGHHDRLGLRDDESSRSWNSSHPSRGEGGGCSQEALRGSGGNGLNYSAWLSNRSNSQIEGSDTLPDSVEKPRMHEKSG